MEKVNEESALWLTVTFFNKNGVEDTPESIIYRIDTENDSVLEETQFPSPAPTIEIMINSDQNKIITGFPAEKRIITISASFGSNDKQNIEIEYEIVNLRKI